jgi:hypothetical protein
MPAYAHCLRHLRHWSRITWVRAAPHLGHRSAALAAVSLACCPPRCETTASAGAPLTRIPGRGPGSGNADTSALAHSLGHVHSTPRNSAWSAHSSIRPIFPARAAAPLALFFRSAALQLGRARLLIKGEEFDGRAENVTGRAPDLDTFKRPIGRVHDKSARHLSGKPASYGAFLIQVSRAVQECNLPIHFSIPPHHADCLSWYPQTR